MKAASCWLTVALGLFLAPRLQADDPPFQASLSCQPAVGPGRILCELTTRATRGKLVWSDALVVRAPAFARPLRSRFVAQLGPPALSGGAWAKLALVASGAAQGKLELLARGVICYDEAAGEWCGPVQAAVAAEIRVSPERAQPL
jgi:hypothetical protein